MDTKTTSNVPNLDAETPDNLMTFWREHQRGRGYRKILPAGGRGSRRAVADLANYASNKATAMQCRARGDIETAIAYERICDDIYDGLPFDVRW